MVAERDGQKTDNGILSPASGAPVTHPTKPTDFAGTPRKPASRGGGSGEYPAKPGEGGLSTRVAHHAAGPGALQARPGTVRQGPLAACPPARGAGGRARGHLRSGA